MPAIVVCASCSTKLKVPEGSSAKALKCPKCKGTVPIAKAAPKPAPPPPQEEEEFEVNDAVDEKDEEFEVNEAADEKEEEYEVDQAVDESEPADQKFGEDSALSELGFLNVDDVFKKANIPDAARKAFEKAFVKKEKPLWAGRPDPKIIESKAWIGLVVGPIAIVVGLAVCLITGGIATFAMDQMLGRIITLGFGALFGLIFPAVGVLAIVFRKRIGGNVQACYVVTNKRAYI
jgi:LSD1 subclass zinc finger protein